MAFYSIIGRVVGMRRKATRARRRSRNHAGGLAAGLMLLLGIIPARAQPVQGDAISVGFQAAVPSRYIVKYGRWFPILLNLTAQGTQAYDVQLQCERIDLDGDRVDYVEPHVAITPEAGVKRVWCYAITLKENSSEPLSIDIIGGDGVRINTIIAPNFESISNDTYVILDISEKRVTGLDRINSPAENYIGFAWGRREYYRSICVATLPSTDLPDRWYGLDAVDVVVWDDPDPDALSIAQLNALIEWVKRGGQLVVGIGAAGAKIQKSALAEIMPLEVTQSPVELQRLEAFRRQFDTLEESFKTAIPVAVGKPTQDALVTFRDSLPDNHVLNLIAMKGVGSGRSIVLAAYLRDLERLRPSVESFYREFLDLNRVEADFKKNELDEMNMFSGVQALYSSIISPIDFRRSASALVLTAFAFVAAYILLATFGAWNWLKQHALTNMSWTTFAVFAIAASALSIGAVTLTRGVTGAVHTHSFVDLQAGSSEAQARTYLGYKSNRRQRVDLSMPGDGDTLEPLCTAQDIPNPYTTPERYQAIASEGVLEGTPMRATLKQFQGSWVGTMEGVISGELIADRATGKISRESWILNGLGTDIRVGYLLYIDPRLRDRDGGVPCRIAGLNKRNDRAEMQNKVWGSDRVPPAFNVLALKLDGIKAGDRLGNLGSSVVYVNFDARYTRWANEEKPNPTEEPWLPTLRMLQVEDWSSSFGMVGGGLDGTDAAALKASTRNLFLHNKATTNFQTVGQPLNTDGLFEHDITHWLTRGQAVLLLISDQPGPADLYIDGDPEEADEGRTLYRVRIPIQYVGNPPRG